MALTAEQFRLTRECGLAAPDFETLWRWHRQHRRGVLLPPLQRAYLAATPQHQLDQAGRYMKVIRRDRLQIACDLITHGEFAHTFYGQLRPRDYAAARPLAAAFVRVPRARSSHSSRPGHRRTVSSRAGPDSGDPDEGGEPEPPADCLAVGPGSWQPRRLAITRKEVIA